MRCYERDTLGSKTFLTLTLCVTLGQVASLLWDSVNQEQGFMMVIRPLWGLFVLSPHLHGLGLCGPGGLG